MISFVWFSPWILDDTSHLLYRSFYSLLVPHRSFLAFLDFVVFKTTLDLIFRASLTSFGLTKASYRQIV